jgi:hypothetical protein
MSHSLRPPLSFATGRAGVEQGIENSVVVRSRRKRDLCALDSRRFHKPRGGCPVDSDLPLSTLAVRRLMPLVPDICVRCVRTCHGARVVRNVGISSTLSFHSASRVFGKVNAVRASRDSASSFLSRRFSQRPGHDQSACSGRCKKKKRRSPGGRFPPFTPEASSNLFVGQMGLGAGSTNGVTAS